MFIGFTQTSIRFCPGLRQQDRSSLRKRKPYLSLRERCVRRCKEFVYIDENGFEPVRPVQLFEILRMVLEHVTAATATPPLVTTHTVKEHQAAKRPLILVSDYNHVNQKLAAKLVERLGYRVDVVADGKKAPEALSRVAYAAVLMDCQMPKMDGFTATQRIRDRSRGQIVISRLLT